MSQTLIYIWEKNKMVFDIYLPHYHVINDRKSTLKRYLVVFDCNFVPVYEQYSLNKKKALKYFILRYIFKLSPRSIQ